MQKINNPLPLKTHTQGCASQRVCRNTTLHQLRIREGILHTETTTQLADTVKSLKAGVAWGSPVPNIVPVPYTSA